MTKLLVTRGIFRELEAWKHEHASVLLKKKKVRKQSPAVLQVNSELSIVALLRAPYLFKLCSRDRRHTAMRLTLLLLLVTFAVSVYAVGTGDDVCLEAGIKLRSSPCGEIIATTSGNEHGVFVSETEQNCSFGNSTWIQVKLANGNSTWIPRNETSFASNCTNAVNLNVPMVHQVWDTPIGLTAVGLVDPLLLVCSVTTVKFYLFFLTSHGCRLLWQNQT